MKLTKILEDMIIDAMDEKKSPLSGKEEEIAKRLKPALKAMQDEYGEEEGKKIFYAKIRKNAKKQ